MVDLLPGLHQIGLRHRQRRPGDVARCGLADDAVTGQQRFGHALIERPLGAKALDVGVLGHVDGDVFAEIAGGDDDLVSSHRANGGNHPFGRHVPNRPDAVELAIGGDHRAGHPLGVAREVRPADALLGDDLDVGKVLDEGLLEAVVALLGHEEVGGVIVLAIQLFVTLIEFKLSTLAGFVLIPFGLFGKTAFMAERVLGNVISSGIKVLVLAVIIGIGSTLFSEFTRGFGGVTPTVDDAMAIVLAALSLVGLGIFGPGIASGLVSGGPQLGAGAAIGTGLAVGGAAFAAGGGAMLAAKGGAAALSGGAAAVRGGATAAGAASSAYTLGSMGQSGGSGVASGAGGIARAAGGAAMSPLRRATGSVKSSFADGVKSGFGTTGGSSTMGTVGGADDAASAPSQATGTPPGWAQRMRRSGHASHAVQTTAHAVRSGDGHGSGSSVNLSESDRS